MVCLRCWVLFVCVVVKYVGVMCVCFTMCCCMVCCLCCFAIVRVGCHVFECVFMRALLYDVVWFVFRCVVVFVCVCVLCLMSLHAVCELSCDDVWCSMCFCGCVCLFVFVRCVCDVLCDVVWYVYFV